MVYRRVLFVGWGRAGASAKNEKIKDNIDRATRFLWYYISIMYFVPTSDPPAVLSEVEGKPGNFCNL